MSKMVKKGGNTDLFVRKHGNILGVGLTGTPKDILLTQIGQKLAKNALSEAKNPLFITTPNPEHVVMAQIDPQFKKILQMSDISLCDGVGLLAAYEFFLRKTHYLSNRSNLTNLLKFAGSLVYVLKNGSASDGLKVIKGREFFLELLALADKKKYKVFLLGSTKAVIDKTASELKRKFPSVQFDYEWDLRLDENGVPIHRKEDKSDKEIIKKINNFHPHLLFVAFGAPKQEKWVYQNLNKLNTKLVMVVGGTFDYIAGKQKLPNKLFERFGLEWLWRLLTGTQKIGRIANALFKFPMLVINNG